MSNEYQLALEQLRELLDKLTEFVEKNKNNPNEVEIRKIIREKAEIIRWLARGLEDGSSYR